MGKREQRRQERELRRLGYRPMTAAAQIILMIRLRLRSRKGGRT